VIVMGSIQQEVPRPVDCSLSRVLHPSRGACILWLDWGPLVATPHGLILIP
jgi:hypothetical protein